MKSVTMTIALSLLTSVAAQAATLPSEVAAFLNKEGKFVDIYNGSETQYSGGTCEVVLNPYGEADSIKIEADIPLKPTAHLEGAKKSTASNGAVVFALNDTGKRVGGSVCGDFSPLTSYKKTVEIKNKVLVIREKFRCGFFEKNEIMSACDLK